MGYKIREAQMQKNTYQIVVGDKEVQKIIKCMRQYGSQYQATVEKDEFIWNLVYYSFEKQNSRQLSQ